MRPSPSRVRPETDQDNREPGRRPASRPVVERVAGWSVRHRKTAVFGWLLLVAVIFMVGQALGTRSVPSYDPGQSGQAERTLDQLTGNSSGAATENVLIQGMTAGQTFGTDEQMRSAARQVAAALAAAPKSAADIRSPLGPGGHSLVSAGGRSALVAAGIPVLLAVSAVIAAISLLSVASQWLPVGSSTSEVVLVIGMAVGVDYSLFYLRREREERAKGSTVAQALQIAAGTSGRAIVVSGLTVMIALSGLFLTGLSVFDGIALGSIAVVGIAVAGSLTVLPALLSWLGPRADRGRIPFLRRAAARPSKLWAIVVRRVVRHPLAWGGAAVIALLALAAPALGMRIGYPAIDAPNGLAVVRTMDRIQQAFPEGPSPAEVVMTGQDLSGPAVRHALAALQGRAAAGGAIREPVTTAVVAGGRALLISVPLAGHGTGTVSDHALVTLRTQILPSTLGQVPGIRYAVTGDTASDYDFTQQVHARAPVVFAVVAAVAFVLLMVAFRSVAIPLVSIGLNLLSVGAAYGLITLIFQDGRLQSLLGYTSFGGIIAWEPLFMFVFLFGISMDYHVFLLSRIRELRSQGYPARDAVVEGIASSAGVVTSAAFIMVAVFSVFATLSLIDLKILGVGMAAAVLIDATVVRGVLLPAALALLGERAWPRPVPLPPELTQE
jgi:RND superfamily putative drug exporter